MASLRSKVETAFAAHLATSGITVPIYKGFSGDDKTEPGVFVVARRAQEEPYASGNYRVTVDVHIKGEPDTGTFDDLCANVRAALWNDTAAADLQASATDLCVFGLSSEHAIEWGEAGDMWVESQAFEIYCAAALTTA